MENKRLVLRRLLFGFVVIISVCVQFSAVRFISIGEAAPLLPLAAVIAIGINESLPWACFFGALAGALTDAFSVGTEGFYAVLFALIAFVCSACMMFFLRRTFPAALLLTAAGALIVNVAYWLVFVLTKGNDLALSLLIGKYLASALYTTLFALPSYPLMKWICKISVKESGHEN